MMKNNKVFFWSDPVSGTRYPVSHELNHSLLKFRMSPFSRSHG
jgi:hypothetical protein